MSIYQKFYRETFDDRGNIQNVDVNLPENFNFGYDVVDAIAAQEPQKRAMVWCNTLGEERFFSFAEISELSNRAANLFLESGISKGDHVMAVLKRHYEYWIVTVALHKIGAILVPVTHMLTAEDMKYRIDAAGIKAIVCSPDNSVPQKLTKAMEGNKTVTCLWSVQKDVAGFRNFTTEITGASAELQRVETHVKEHILLYFTSGTTGYPKGVIHDHSYPLAHFVTAKYWQQAEDGGLHFTVAETGWAKTSWGKIYGQWLVGSAVMVFDFDNFDPKQLITIINRYQVTSFCAPPTVYRYLVKKGISPMPSLKHASTAGEALSPDVFTKFKEKSGLTLMEGFGQTESTLIVANLAGSTPRPGSMGRPTPFYDVAVVRADGSEADTDEVGELVVVPRNGKRPVGVFCAYLGDDERYDYVWRGGVYHTGDTVWKDADGHLWFNGRIDDIIKTGGFRVGPSEIENVLMTHPAVMECSVVGIADTLRTQAIKAFVVLAPGYEASPALKKEIREFCNARVAEYKWIRSLEFVEAMPKTISGKIKKTELRVRAQ